VPTPVAPFGLTVPVPVVRPLLTLPVAPPPVPRVPPVVPLPVTPPGMADDPPVPAPRSAPVPAVLEVPVPPLLALVPPVEPVRTLGLETLPTPVPLEPLGPPLG